MRHYFDKLWPGEVGVWVFPDTSGKACQPPGFIIEMHNLPTPKHKAYLVIPVLYWINGLLFVLLLGFPFLVAFELGSISNYLRKNWQSSFLVLSSLWVVSLVFYFFAITMQWVHFRVLRDKVRVSPEAWEWICVFRVSRLPTTVKFEDLFKNRNLVTDSCKHSASSSSSQDENKESAVWGDSSRVLSVLQGSTLGRIAPSEAKDQSQKNSQSLEQLIDNMQRIISFSPCALRVAKVRPLSVQGLQQLKSENVVLSEASLKDSPTYHHLHATYVDLMESQEKHVFSSLVPVIVTQKFQVIPLLSLSLFDPDIGSRRSSIHWSKYGQINDLYSLLIKYFPSLEHEPPLDEKEYFIVDDLLILSFYDI